MRILSLLLCLLIGNSSLLAETTKEEKRLLKFGQDAMSDHLYDLAETKFQDLLNQFPQSEYRDEATWLLAKSRLNQGRWYDAVTLLEARLPNVAATWQDDYYFIIGEAQLKGEIGEEALKTYQNLMVRFPKSKYLAEARLGVGRALLQQQKFEAAQEILRTFQKEDRELVAKSTLYLGTSFVLQKKYDQAAELFNRLIKEERNTTIGFQAIYALGEMELDRKQLESARSKFEALAKSEIPEAQGIVPLALFRIGQAEAATNNWLVAARNYEEAFRKSDDSSFRLQCVRELSEVYLRSDKAESLVDKLKGWAESNSKTRLGESLQLEICALWQKAGKRDQSIEAFQNYFEKYPDGFFIDLAYLQRGRVFLEDKKYETASSDFQKAIERARTPQLQSEAWLRLGDLRFEQLQYATAAVAYMKSAQVKSADAATIEKAYYQAANAYFEAGGNAEVLRVYSNYTAQFPDGKFGPEFLLIVAKVNRRAGDFQKVSEAYKTLLDRYENSSHAPKTWVMYAESLFSLGKCKDSIDVSTAFVEKYPKSEFKSEALLNRARCLERLEQFDLALAEFEMLAKTYPKTSIGSEARFWLGCYFDRQKNYAKSQEQFELLRKGASPQDPLIPEATYLAALAAYRLGQNKEDASHLLENLVKQYPTSPWVFDARFLYGDILTERGKFQDALLIFEDLSKKDDPINKAHPADRVLEAHGRRGQCLRQLKRYDDANQAFKMILDAPKAEASLRNQAYVELGKTYEVVGDSERALENYLAPLYGINLVIKEPEAREYFWVCKGGFEAVRLLEGQKKWKGVAGVLKRMIDSNLSCRKEAEERLKRLKTEHADAN
jgi:TolA-binding protein